MTPAHRFCISLDVSQNQLTESAFQFHLIHMIISITAQISWPEVAHHMIQTDPLEAIVRYKNRKGGNNHGLSPGSLVFKHGQNGGL